MRKILFLPFVLLPLFLALPVVGQKNHRIVGLDDAALAGLGKVSQVEDRLRVESMALFDGPTVVLEMERFDVLAPGAAIHVWDGETTRTKDPQSFSFWRGRIEDEGDSSAFLMIDEGGEVRGFVSTQERFFLIGSEEVGGTLRKVARQVQNSPETEKRFECENASSPLHLAVGDLFADLGFLQEGLPLVTRSTLPAYAVDVAVETDFEFYQLFQGEADPLAAAEAYIYTLFGGIATIYDRDVDTQLRVSDLWLYTTSTESPCNWYGCKYLWVDTNGDGVGDEQAWVCSPSYLLEELQSCWNGTPSRQGVSRNLVHLVSGKHNRPPEAKYGGFGGGVAYVGVLGGSGWSCGNARQYAYGVTASIDGNYDPNSSSMYWDFSAVAHEIGHNFNTGHTHSYTPPVDYCYDDCLQADSNGNCISWHHGVRPLYVPSDGGTIMSYCHLLAGQQIIQPWFGRDGYYGVDSERVPARMLSHVIGADQVGCLPEPTVSNAIFTDGFESGNTNSWN